MASLRNTAHYSLGVHIRPKDRWLLQFGVTHDTSPVSKSDRTADMPIDREDRLAAGVQYETQGNISLGGSVVYADFGDAKINSSTLIGEYGDSEILIVAFNLNYKLKSGN